MSSPFVIIAIYRFVRLDNFEEFREPLLQIMTDNRIRGTILLAAEGINGTVAGDETSIEILLDYLRRDERLCDFDCKRSYDTEMPFYRSCIKLKPEIVTMGVADIDTANRGNYVKPTDWNRLISNPEVTLIDTRNDYESAIGSFAKAFHSSTKSFREFPAYVKQNLNPHIHRKVAMFCTGGIRCEKSTAYLKQLGFDEVYHLQGGILKYLEQVPQSESLWQGECFVFDNRVSVNHDLDKGSFDQCHACRLPITVADKASEKYQPGVSCPACYETTSSRQRERFREREKQVQLARSRGERHFGADAAEQSRQRKTLKLEAKQRQGSQSG